MTGKPSHTPGPWAAEGLLIAKPHYRSDPIAWVARSLGDRDDVIRANANLIAAAPDLYEALEAMLKSFDDRQINPNFKPFPAVAKAEAALAKARGIPSQKDQDNG